MCVCVDTMLTTVAMRLCLTCTYTIKLASMYLTQMNGEHFPLYPANKSNMAEGFKLVTPCHYFICNSCLKKTKRSQVKMRSKEWERSNHSVKSFVVYNFIFLNCNKCINTSTPRIKRYAWDGADFNEVKKPLDFNYEIKCAKKIRAARKCFTHVQTKRLEFRNGNKTIC